MNKKITIYTTNYCPYCVKAKALLDKKELAYEEIDVTGNAEAREQLVLKANGRKTVPQIFIDDHSIGGCDDLYALEAAGELEKLTEDN